MAVLRMKWFMNLSLLSSQTILSKKSSAQMGFRVNPVLARNSCILCYISLFTEIIFQQFDALKIEIQGTLTKLCAFQASRGHPSKMVKLPLMSPGVLSRTIELLLFV